MTVARRAMEVLRTEGPVSLWFKVLGETVYRRVVVAGRSLEPPLPRPPQPEVPVEISLLRLEDVDRYLALRRDLERAEVERRLAAGDRCLVAWLGGEIVHGGWLAFRPVWSDYLGMEISPAPAEAYIYETYTAPSHRRRGIGSARSSAALLTARDEGCRSVMGIIMPENRKALGAMRTMGFEPCGVVGWIGIGRWRHEFERRRLIP